VQPAPRPADAISTPLVAQLKAGGLFNPAWDAIHQLDPQWLEEFLAMGAEMYRGVLSTKLVELMAIAVDACCTHLYTPGIRRHVQRALAEGATIEEIVEVLKLCAALGVDACELGTPILSEELANQETTWDRPRSGPGTAHPLTHAALKSQSGRRPPCVRPPLLVCGRGAVNRTRARTGPGGPGRTSRGR
jgi:alkylhydroperoxidase/carboxymuconolactone decarboxylase family protein YurZ